MIDSVRQALRKIRDVLAWRAENAYKDRDAAEEGSRAQTYAAGEAHAYGVASDDARIAGKEEGE